MNMQDRTTVYFSIRQAMKYQSIRIQFRTQKAEGE